jgi:hypothetical protein
MHGVCLLSMKGVQREGQSVNVLGWVLVSSWGCMLLPFVR